MQLLKKTIVFLVFTIFSILVYGITPTPPPMPTPDSYTPLVLEYRCLESNDSAKAIRFSVNIINPGEKAVDLSLITAEYYYQREGVPVEEFSVDYAALGEANITGVFGARYFLLGFTTGAGVLAPGGETGEIQIRLFDTDGSSYTQGNDYSFDGSITDMTLYQKIPVYIENFLTWGSPWQPERYTLTILNPSAGNVSILWDMTQYIDREIEKVYNEQTIVYLSASTRTIAGGYPEDCPLELHFVQWEGDVPGGVTDSTNINITMDGDKIIKALFMPVPQPCPEITPPVPSTPIPCDLSNVLVVSVDKNILSLGATVEVTLSGDFLPPDPEEAVISENTSGDEALFEFLGDNLWQAVRTGVTTFTAAANVGIYCDGEYYQGPVSGTTGFVNVINEISSYMTGDVNADGFVDIVDALMTARNYVGISINRFIPELADVNSNGSVDIIDALMIAQFYVGLIPGFTGQVEINEGSIIKKKL